MSRPLHAFLLLTAASIIRAQECTLDCPVDAPCTVGSADFTKHNLALGLTSDGTMHCACPFGWTGLLCDHKYESCTETDDHACYHGGSCIPGLSDRYGNDQLFCDCTDAVASDGTHYVGKYCETPFDQICDHSHDDDGLFCVNGGECNPNYEYVSVFCGYFYPFSSSHHSTSFSSFFRSDGVPCSCPNDFEGFHCEFKAGTVPDCDLQCGNGGTCVVGVRNPAEAEHFHHAWSQLDISAHLRCLCPPNFGGPLCESTAEPCGEDDFCYHGGSCVETTISSGGGGTRTTDYHCDCTTAGDGDGNLFAGQFCQFVSSDICSSTDENLFCVNGGTCDDQDARTGCYCPHGFDGFKCDILLGIGGNTGDDAADDSDEVDLCGDVYCFNGGKCVEEVFTTENGDNGRRDVCDCSDATDGDGDFFAGPSCQYKATDSCTLPNGIAFCVNGGICPVTPDGGCDCRDGWTGDSCEIHTLAEKDPGDPTCGSDGNVCLNGGNCVELNVVKPDDSVEIRYHCDCTQAFDEKHLYAGESCQHPSTHLCTHPQDGESLEGHLFCANHGTCNRNVLRGCDCLGGFSGMSCEYETVDEDPNEGADEAPDVERCGSDLICHNGGSCVSTLINTFDGGTRTIDHCDCRTAVTVDTIFSGPECQYEATSFCTLPAEGAGLESSLFCVNGGDCRDNVLQGCSCPTGWSGLSCEFAEDTEDLLDGDDDLDTIVACGDMFCYNGGECDVAVIVGDDGGVTDEYSCDCINAFNGEHLFAGPTCQFQSTDLCTDLEEGESLLGKSFCVNHGRCAPNPQDGCECPPGWTGSNCEIEVDDEQHSEHGEECGDGYCYNGGNCVTTRISRPDKSVSEEYHCDCSNAITSTALYAGESCEHKSTDFCSHPQVEGNLNGVLFCVNGGKCEDNPLEGCDCPPQWSGFSCQFETEPEDIQDSLDDTGDDLEDCGDVGVCLNGGECVTTTVVSGDGDRSTIQHCDCFLAYNQDDIFAGPQCEFRSTSNCTVPEPGEGLGGILFCVNGGSCMENVNQGCDCPPAWTGLRCEFQVEEDDFRDDDTNFVEDFVPCGSDYCYHGGICEKATINGMEMDTCDCATAVTATDLYAGEFCQYKSTQFCSEPDGNDLTGIEFCTNEGQCSEDECHCPTGYSGSHCEYPLYANQDSEDNIAPDNGQHDDDDDADYQQCHLQCQNNGICAKGAKDLGSLEDTVQHVEHLNQTYSSDFFEHCICPEGWIGIECDHKAEVCGDNEHICLHGSTCVKNNQQHGCDCSVADEQATEDGHPLYAGDSCQHPATDICMNTEDYPGRPLYFCVNQGTCRDYVGADDGFPGCDCSRDWTGPHCEVHVESLAQDSANNAKTSVMIFLSLFVSVAAVALVLVGYSYCIRRRREDQSRSCMDFRTRRQHSIRRFVIDPNEQRANFAPKRHDATDPPAVFSSNSDPMTAGLTLPPDDEPESYHDEPMESYRDEPVVVNIGPPRDEDGHELHNVDFDSSNSNDVDFI
jgi:hypothetical protein